MSYKPRGGILLGFIEGRRFSLGITRVPQCARDRGERGEEVGDRFFLAPQNLRIHTNVVLPPAFAIPLVTGRCVNGRWKYVRHGARRNPGCALWIRPSTSYVSKFDGNRIRMKSHFQWVVSKFREYDLCMTDFSEVWRYNYHQHQLLSNVIHMVFVCFPRTLVHRYLFTR